MNKTKRVFVQKKTHAYILPGIYGVGHTYSHGMTPVFKGKNFGTTLVTMKEGVMCWYALEYKIKEVADKAFAIVKKNPDYVSEVRKKFEKIVPQLTNFTSKVFKTNLQKLSNKKIWQIVEKYLKLYNEIYPWAEPIVLGLEESLGNYLRNYLKERIIDCTNLKSLTEIYNILVSPSEKSFVRREADELLLLALQVQNDFAVKKIFLAIKDEEDLKQKLPGIYKKLKKHEFDYCWVPYDYGVYLWDFKYFFKVLQDLVETRNVCKDLENSKDYYKTLSKRQIEVVKKYQLDTHHQKLFGVLRDGAYLLDYKKEKFTKSHYEIMPVFREIARRFGSTEAHVRLYSPAELKAALLKNKIILEENLVVRYKCSVYYWNKNKFAVYDGKKAEKMIEENIKEEEIEGENSLGGVIASAGKYVGRVRVVLHPSELNEFQEGEILVAEMTSPDYVPAMKKAGAIITDKGGVTCHAAVVSRELGVPCVVGAGNATKILKTGELVEVNANHNSVKILKK